MSAMENSSPGVVSASERLTLSRERLRLSLRKDVAAQTDAMPQSHGASHRGWLDSLKSTPGAGIVIEAAGLWWAQHPLRVASMLTADAVKSLAKTTAQRHPLGLVAGGLVLGGLIAWSRPWRVLQTPALLAGMLPQLLTKALSLVPPGSWMVVLASLAQQQSRAQKSADQTDSRQETAGPR
jgi:hypothetical protein